MASPIRASIDAIWVLGWTWALGSLLEFDGRLNQCLNQDDTGAMSGGRRALIGAGLHMGVGLAIKL